MQNSLLLTSLVCLSMMAAVCMSHSSVCGPYERPIINMIGEIKCIPKAGSCDGSKDFFNDKSCDERGPCFDHRLCYYKHLRTQCIPDACNPCKPRIYDHLFREVCQGEY